MKWGPNNNIYPWSRTWDQPVSATFVIFDPPSQRIKLPKLSLSLPWKLVFQSSAPPELGDKSLGTSSPERIRFLSRVPEIMWAQLSLELVWIKLAQFSLNAKLADIHRRQESGVSGGWGYWYKDVRKVQYWRQIFLGQSTNYFPAHLDSSSWCWGWRPRSSSGAARRSAARTGHCADTCREDDEVRCSTKFRETLLNRISHDSSGNRYI